jgi:hypothetical protein
MASAKQQKRGVKLSPLREWTEATDWPQWNSRSSKASCTKEKMMPQFLFCFGFCTPEQLAANDLYGGDDESSECFFVTADSRESALLWGCEVAEAFWRYLFKGASSGRDAPSWREARFAFWLEEDPESAFPGELLRLPLVKDGEMPDFSRWLFFSS